MKKWLLAVALALPACKSSTGSTPPATTPAAPATAAAARSTSAPAAADGPARTLVCRDSESKLELAVVAASRGYQLTGPGGVTADARHCNVSEEDTGSAYVFRERFRFTGTGLTVDMFVESSRGSPPELVSARYQAGESSRELMCRDRVLDAGWYGKHGCLAAGGKVVSLKFDSIQNFGNGPVVHMVDPDGRKYTFHGWKGLVYDDGNPYFEIIREEGAVLPREHRIREAYAGRFLDVAYETKIGEIDESAESKEYDSIVWIEKP